MPQRAQWVKTARSGFTLNMSGTIPSPFVVSSAPFYFDALNNATIDSAARVTAAGYRFSGLFFQSAAGFPLLQVSLIHFYGGSMSTLWTAVAPPNFLVTAPLGLNQLHLPGAGFGVIEVLSTQLNPSVPFDATFTIR